MNIKSPAKINLFFEILDKRSDGFHEIVSVAVPVRLFDTLTFESTDNESIQLECIGNDNVPVDDSNLVVKAAKMIKNRFDIRFGANIKLFKRIPIQSGLGGGSSNAVTTLRLACQNWGIPISDAELLSIAAELGSDCPLFFHDVPTISMGRGERVKPLPPIPTLWLVLLKPPEGLSTAQVFAESEPCDKPHLVNDLLAAMSQGDVHKIAHHLFNRLEVPAKKIWNRFDEVREQMLSSGCLATQMTGSGTAFFGLCENESHANEVFRRLRHNSAHDDKVFLVRT